MEARREAADGGGRAALGSIGPAAVAVAGDVTSRADVDRALDAASRLGGGTPSAPGPLRSKIATLAPSRAYTLAISAPKPEAAPVTSAVLP